MKLALIALTALSAVACSSSETAPTGASTPTVTPAATTATASGKLTVEVVAGKCSPHSDGPMTAAMSATQSGSDLRVEVTDYQTYCESDVTYSVADEGGTVHITAGKPGAVSRCVCPHHLTMTVHGVAAGDHRIVFDELPYASTAVVGKTIAEGRIAMK